MPDELRIIINYQPVKLINKLTRLEEIVNIKLFKIIIK